MAHCCCCCCRWDFITLHDARMESLRHSKGAVVCTWVYCILWFIVQDAAKVATYKVMERLRSQAEVSGGHHDDDRGS